MPRAETSDGSDPGQSAKESGMNAKQQPVLSTLHASFAEWLLPGSHRSFHRCR
jgi:hypothetical protein